MILSLSHLNRQGAQAGSGFNAYPLFKAKKMGAVYVRSPIMLRFTSQPRFYLSMM